MTYKSVRGIYVGMVIETIPKKLSQLSENLTKSERKIADIILENYPISGLGAITNLANKAGVSTPTITRLVNKLGFDGFSQFQESLRQELDFVLSNDVRQVNPWSPKIPEAHVLNRITESVVGNVKQSLDDVDVADFEGMCDALADPKRSLFIVGGRITKSLAGFFYQFMQVIRPNIHFINNLENSWHYNMINIKKDDIFLIYDIRRYEASLLSMAKCASELGAEIILITDQWKSPINKFSKHCLNCRTAMPTGRDSMVSLMLLNEVIIAQVQHELGSLAKQRTADLEKIFKETKFFQK